MTITELNKLEPGGDYVMTIAKNGLSTIFPDLNFDHYLAVLKQAISIEPLPCGTKLYGDIYRRAASDGQWLAFSFIKDAESTAATSRLLWSLGLKFQAVGKSREATAILDLLNVTFEGAIAPELRQELQKLVPDYPEVQFEEEFNFKANGAMVEYLQINIASIRSIIQLNLQSDGISQYCLPENEHKATALVNSILSKRLQIFAFTARIINEQIPEVDLFSRCLYKFNRQTSEEPIDLIYHARFGTYP